MPETKLNAVVWVRVCKAEDRCQTLVITTLLLKN